MCSRSIGASGGPKEAAACFGSHPLCLEKTKKALICLSAMTTRIGLMTWWRTLRAFLKRAQPLTLPILNLRNVEEIVFNFRKKIKGRSAVSKRKGCRRRRRGFRHFRPITSLRAKGKIPLNHPLGVEYFIGGHRRDAVH